MKKENRNTLIILSAALVVVIGLIAYLSLSPNTAAQAGNVPNEDDMRVSLSEAKAASDAGEALIVDVRSESEFNKSRIPGSILIPVGDIEGNEPEVDKDALILTYCT